MIELKHIIEKTHDLFKKFGIRSVSMDDVSAGLGMSKKTLYEHVQDKNELVERVFDNDFVVFKNSLLKETGRAKDAIHQIIGISNVIQKFIKNYSTAIEFDLRKYYPTILDKYQNAYVEIFSDVFSENLKWGINDGLFRNDINVEIITKLQIAQINSIVSSNIFGPEDYLNSDFLSEILRYHINGIVSKKGEMLLMKYSASDQNEINKIHAI